jgi:hypothetical protein
MSASHDNRALGVDAEKRGNGLVSCRAVRVSGHTDRRQRAPDRLVKRAEVPGVGVPVECHHDGAINSHTRRE